MTCSSDPCGPISSASTPYQALLAVLAEETLRERTGEPGLPCLPDAVARWVDTTFRPAATR